MQRTKISTLSQISALKSINTLSIGIKTLAIAMATLAFFYQDLIMVFTNALHDEASVYLLAIPFLFLYLLYRKRKMLRAVIPLEKTDQPKSTRHLALLSGVLLSATAIILYWFGSYTFNPLEYHILTLPIFTAGLVLILFNPQTLRQLAFPIAFLAFLQPLPSNILYGLGSTMSVLSAEASSAIVNGLGIPARISSQYGNPTIIITGPNNATLPFTVDLACSGIFSLLGFVIFAVFIAFISRGSYLKKAGIFMMGLPLIFLLNITRISIILSIGHYYGEDLALQVFHLLGATVLLFIGTLIILVVSDRFFKPPLSLPSCPTCSAPVDVSVKQSCLDCGKLLEYPRARLRSVDAAKIVAICAVVVLLLSIQAPVFALTQGPAQITIQTPTGEQGNTELLPTIQGYTPRFDYRDRNFEQLAAQDASLLYSYRPSNTSKETIIVAIEIAQSRSSLHPWETCLITWPQTHGYQPSVTQLDLRDTQILQNPPIIARYFAFQYKQTNDTQVVLYWFETSTFTVNNTAQQKQVKISLIAYPNKPQEVADSENQLLSVAVAIANYWEPIKTWTQIALAISQNGPALAMATTILLAITVTYQLFINRQEKKSGMRLYKKLPTQQIQLIQAVKLTSKEAVATPNSIATHLLELTGEPVDATTLTKRLVDAESAHLIERKIGNRNDEPIIRWKSQIVLTKIKPPFP
jgi:exosortase